MTVKLSENEVNVIKVWADTCIHGGHWGDGDIVIPEEDIILKKLENMKGDRLTLTENEARLILMWSDSSRGIHTMEESNVIKKLKSNIERKI